MNKYFKFFLICFCVFIPWYSYADYDCSKFKFDVDVNVKIIYEDVKTKQSDEELIGLNGYASPNLSWDTPYDRASIMVHGGYCVALRWMDVYITLKPEIVIDRNIKENSCVYNIVLKHEQDHINVYKKILKENKDYIKQSVYKVANSINPVFIKDLSEIENNANFYRILKENDIIKKMEADIKSKIDSENQKIEERGDHYNMWKCNDFYKERKEKVLRDWGYTD